MDAVRSGLYECNGGIVGLAAFVAEHAGAIEYDLLTKTGHEIKDVGATLSWEALTSFVFHGTPDSALARELNEEEALWALTMKTNGILADIFDMLSRINTNLVAIAEKKKATPITPYPRPGVEQSDDNTQRIGSGALPVSDLHSWMEEQWRN